MVNRPVPTVEVAVSKVLTMMTIQFIRLSSGEVVRVMVALVHPLNLNVDILSSKISVSETQSNAAMLTVIRNVCGTTIRGLPIPLVVPVTTLKFVQVRKATLT